MKDKRREQTRRKHEAIKGEYDRLKAIKEHGVQKYSNEYITRRVAAKYFVSPATVDKIVY